MNLEAIRRRRVLLGLALLVVAVWLLFGLHRVDPSRGVAVLDSPLGFLTPRVPREGWCLAPPGLLRLTLYPALPVTLSFRQGESDRAPLVTREGTAVTATGTIRYRVDPDRVLEVHRALAWHYENALGRWVGEERRRGSGTSDE